MHLGIMLIDDDLFLEDIIAFASNYRGFVVSIAMQRNGLHDEGSAVDRYNNNILFILHSTSQRANDVVARDWNYMVM